MSSDKCRIWQLRPQTELRVEAETNKKLYLTLREGTAEVFGTELILGERLTLQGHKIAVFTWQGCQIELAADCSLNEAADCIYESDDTPMREYLNVHEVLEARRQEADRRQQGLGPRTMVVGPTDVGKSTLCRLLLNYAVRTGWAPTMVDLDIGQGGITAPGSVGATPVEGPIDVQEGLPVEVPLVYFYGSPSPSDNPELYRLIVDRLAQLLHKRASLSPVAGASGMVINTMGFIDGLGYDLLLHAMHALKVDVVIVLGQDRLYSQLQAQLRALPHVAVIKQPRSGGVVARAPAARRNARVSKAWEYFHGARGQLQPHVQTAAFPDLRIYRIGSAARAPSQGVLPVGAQSQADPLRVAPVSHVGEMLNCMLAVSHADSPEQLLSANVAGFLYVTSVDPRATPPMVTYMAPCSGPLPGKFLLLGPSKMLFPEQKG